MSNYDPSSACFENAVLAENENCQDWNPVCTDSTACNYNESSNTDDGSCTYATCMLSDGQWSIDFTTSPSPAITGSGENWAFTSARLLGQDTVLNFIGDSIDMNLFTLEQSWGAFDENNTSVLTSDCYTGSVSMTVVFDVDSTGAYLTDFDFTMNGEGFTFSSISSIVNTDVVSFADGSVAGGFTNIVDPVSLGCETCSAADENGMMTIMMLDENGTGTADCDDVYGCMNEEACNYNAAATVDNEECVYTSTVQN